MTRSSSGIFWDMEHVKGSILSPTHTRRRFAFTRPHLYSYSLLSAKRVRVSGTARREGRLSKYVLSIVCTVADHSILQAARGNISWCENKRAGYAENDQPNRVCIIVWMCGNVSATFFLEACSLNVWITSSGISSPWNRLGGCFQSAIFRGRALSTHKMYCMYMYLYCTNSTYSVGAEAGLFKKRRRQFVRTYVHVCTYIHNIDTFRRILWVWAAITEGTPIIGQTYCCRFWPALDLQRGRIAGRGMLRCKAVPGNYV